MNTKRKTQPKGRSEVRQPATITVVSRLTPETHELFREYAFAQRRSISKQIRVLIEDAVSAEREAA